MLYKNISYLEKDELQENAESQNGSHFIVSNGKSRSVLCTSCILFLIHL